LKFLISFMDLSLSFLGVLHCYWVEATAVGALKAAPKPEEGFTDSSKSFLQLYFSD
jgi:hypothetical protein